MKKSLLPAAIAALTLASCSSDSVVDQQAGKTIGFTVRQDNATRGLPITSTNILTEAKDFEVYGFLKTAITNPTMTAGAQFVGTSASVGTPITYSDAKGEWDYKTSTDRKYWPASKIDFYALNPITTGTTNLITSKSFTGSTAPTFAYEAPETNADQKDILYAYKPNWGINDFNGKVPFVFKHALSQIVFRGRTVDDDNLKVYVGSIKICEVKNTGTFTYPSVETAISSTAGTWAVTGTTYKDYAAGLDLTAGDGSAIATANEYVLIDNTSTTSPINLTKEDGALLLIPQELANPWDPTASDEGINTATTGAKAVHHSYLEIECYIESNGTSLVGSKTGTSPATLTYAKSYVPFSTPTGGWIAGKKYIYTINFGTGYKDDGTPWARPITYTVSAVEDWDPATPSPVVDLQ